MAKIVVITPVKEPTEWLLQMVAAKKDGFIHICVDPKDLNKALKGLHHPMTTVEDDASQKEPNCVWQILSRAYTNQKHGNEDEYQFDILFSAISPNTYG
ncbi:unnamed protein product [Porites evermanni]|uniref:Uncharacterized protein n=1 Tax=Porites evermanni TaxID=104178 RepID=A0ABN8R427_9CNID|nr:unnamed protein product [Porites evermanni]